MGNIYNLIFIFGAQYLYIVVIVIAFVWFLMLSRLKRKEILVFLCICLPLIYLTSKIAGHIYYNPRPFVSGHFKPLIPHKADNGFPSHHVLLVSAISAIIFSLNRRAGYVLWGMTLFIGISRIYVGVHHPLDIAGSILISIGIVAIAYFTTAYFKGRNDR